MKALRKAVSGVAIGYGLVCLLGGGLKTIFNAPSDLLKNNQEPFVQRWLGNSFQVAVDIPFTLASGCTRLSEQADVYDIDDSGEKRDGGGLFDGWIKVEESYAPGPEQQRLQEWQDWLDEQAQRNKEQNGLTPENE